LRTILDLLHKGEIQKNPTEMMENYIAQNTVNEIPEGAPVEVAVAEEAPLDDRTKEETEKDDTDLYNISKFSV
jgi:hypothetical protein